MCIRCSARQNGSGVSVYWSDCAGFGKDGGGIETAVQAQTICCILEVDRLPLRSEPTQG